MCGVISQPEVPTPTHLLALLVNQQVEEQVTESPRNRFAQLQVTLDAKPEFHLLFDHTMEAIFNLPTSVDATFQNSETSERVTSSHDTRLKYCENKIMVVVHLIHTMT